MMGMASLEQKTAGIQSRLSARAFVVADPDTGRRIALLSADIWSCTQAVKVEVVKRLQGVAAEARADLGDTTTAVFHLLRKASAVCHSLASNPWLVVVFAVVDM